MEANPYPWLVQNAMWKEINANIATASIVSRDIFVSDGYYRVRAARLSFSVTSTSGTLQVETLLSGENAGAGVDQLTGTMDLSGTADTPVLGVVIAEPTLISPGDRVGIVLAGTLTGLINCLLTVYVERLQKGILG